MQLGNLVNFYTVNIPIQFQSSIQSKIAVFKIDHKYLFCGLSFFKIVSHLSRLLLPSAVICLIYAETMWKNRKREADRNIHLTQQIKNVNLLSISLKLS